VGLGLVALAPPATAGIGYQWGDYHWNKSPVFQVALGDNVSGVWDAQLALASTQWSSNGTPLTTSVTGGGTNAKTCKPTAGRVEVCNSKYGQNGWLGIASIWASGNHITQGTVKLNDSYFSTPSYNKAEWRDLVACQEIGHTFGLGHIDENFNNVNKGTCMDYTNAPSGGTLNGFDYGPSNRGPSSGDFDLLTQIYAAHLGETGGAAAAKSPSAAAVGNSQADWGRAQGHGGPNGMADEFVKDLGDGQVIVTHVFWAE
jgi:hypothetical protein